MKTKTPNSPIASPAKKTIAIIQITRFGDLIQTIQATADFRKNYPQYRIVLIARTQFSHPLHFLLKKTFDHVYSLDTANIFSEHETKGLNDSISKLNIFLNEIKQESFEVLVNLSFSKSSCYLTSLIPSHFKIGPYYDLNSQLIINDKWSQMLYSTVMRGNLNPFGLVDLFKNIIGLKASPPKGKHLNLVHVEKKKNIIIHPFASQERKIWRTEKWIEIIYKTLKENDQFSITIVGTKNEAMKAQTILENPILKPFNSRLINLAGKTSIEELYNELESSVLFVGHDSMVGHLASLVNTTSITVSLGNVRPHETTPYSNQAYNISPKTKCFPCFPSDTCQYYHCHHEIPYQVINAMIKDLIEQKEINSEWTKKHISSFHLSSVNIYKSQIVDEKQRLANLVEAHQDINEIFKTLYRITWSFVISEEEEVLAFPKLTSQTHGDLLKALKGLQYLYELADFGQKYSRYILEEISSQSPSVAKIKDFSKKIDEIDELQKIVQKTSPHLSPIIDYFAIRKANLFGDNIVKLTESSYSTFNDYADFCRIMYELIENTISEFKNMNRNSNVRTDINK